MRCAIMQPTYLPWYGYFNLIASCDVFVFLDNVQFERRSWQSRNRILLNGREHLLSVPTKKVARESLINEIETTNEHGNWREKHISLIRHAYAKAPYGLELLDILEPVFESSTSDKLVSINCLLIKTLSKALMLETRFIDASLTNCIGKRSSLLYSICRSVNADEYLSPVGSKEYLDVDGVFHDSGVSLLFQSYKLKEYTQLGTPKFVSHLSVVDLIAQVGLRAAQSYIL